GGRGRTNNFFHSIGMECLSEPTAAPRIFFHAATKHPKTARRTNAKAKNISVLCWKKQVPRAWSVKTWALYRITCGQTCAHSVSLDSKSRNGKFVVNT